MDGRYRAAGDDRGDDRLGSAYLRNKAGREIRRSLRLNPALATAESAIDGILDSAEGRQEIRKVVVELPKGGMMTARRRGRRQRGGELGDILSLYGILDDPTAQEKAETLRIAAMAAIFNGTEKVKAGWTASEPMRQASKQYFIENYAPLYTTGARLAAIVGGLAHELIVRAPVTTIMLTTGAAGYTVNFFRWLFNQYNEIGRGAAADLLKDDRAKSAAAAAVGGAKEALQTGVAVAFVANQLGLLPVSAVLAAILWQIQASFGTNTGRAYLVAGFYAWYNDQDVSTKTEIETAAKKYAADAQSAAKKNAPAVKAATKNAAAALGALLAKGSAATGSAFQAVAAAVMENGGKVNGAPVAVGGDGGAALVGGAPAAAIAAGEAITGAAGPGLVAVADPAAVGPGAAGPGLVAVGEGDGDGAAGPDLPAVGEGDGDGAASALSVGPRKRRSRGEPEVGDGDGALEDGDGAAAMARPPPPGVVGKRPKGKLDPRRAVAADPFVPGKGGRKTRKPKSKRRVTRRRKAQKVLGTPVFIY